MTTPESKIKKEIKDYLKFKGIFYISVAGGPYTETGSPDLVCCYNGRFIGLEVKTPTGRVSKWQERKGREIQAAGGIFAVPRSVDDVKELIENIIPKTE